MSLRLLLLISLIAALLATAAPDAARSAAVAASPAEASAPAADGGQSEPLPLRFRRVYAPADRLDDWPWGNVRYMPMEPAEFERLLGSAEGTGRPAFASVRIVAAEYRAVLDGDTLTAGRASLQVVQSASAAALQSLDPCNLAIGEARWAGQPANEAKLGLGSAGRLQVLVAGRPEATEENTDQLDFEWSLSGQPDAEDAVDFRFELPACPANRVILDLPERMTPVVDQGLVYPTGPVDESVRRWQIELGGHHRFNLRVLRGVAGQPPPQLPLVRESVTYQFQPHGLDVVDELEFEALDGPVRQVGAVLDPGLVLASAEWGDTLVPWSQGPSSDAGQTPIAITLPEPANEARRVLRLRALAPLVSDRPWQLPRISIEGVLWQEGTATLLVPSQLILQRLLPIGCRQTGTGPLAGDWGGELVQFQYLTADATVEVALSRRRWPVQMSSGTAVELSDRGATARMVADFRVTEEPRFVLDADVAPGWVIDSIESFPAEAMEDWAPGRSRGRRRSLTIRLAESLAPSRPLRLVINARRFRSPLGGTLGVVDLVPLQFQVSEDGVSEDSRRLVAVRALGTYQLRLGGTEQLQRIDPRDLDAAERSLFAETPAELLFENDAGAGELRISLANRPAGYAAQIDVEAVVGKTSLREDYTLRCMPESPRVDRVVVHLSSRRASPVRWTFADEEEQQISARPFSDDELEAAGLTAEQEAWELTLRRPMSTAFEIRGTRESKLLGERPISLASMPEASDQRATLVVRSSGPMGVRIHNRRLAPIPAEAAPPGQYETVRAAYRYDPVGDVEQPSEAAVTVSLAAEAATPSAWVWDCRLESRYEASGAGRHLATYRVQNSGGKAIQVDLPSGVTAEDVCGIWVDRQRVAPDRPASGAANRLSIALPPGEQFPVVSILFETAASRLGTIGSLGVPLPTVDLKVLARQWIVSLPPAYEACDVPSQGQPSATPRVGWSRRLFGFLGRSADQGPFDPLGAIVRLATRRKTPEPTPMAAAGELQQSEQGESPWKAAGPAGLEPAETRGWNTYRLSVSGTLPVRLQYVHRPTVRLLGSVVFLLTVTLGWWTGRDRPQVLIALAGVFGLAALVLPEGYVPVASGAVLGLLFCLGYRLIGGRRAGRRPVADRSEGTDPPHGSAPATTLATTVAGVVALVALVLGAPCVAARAADSPAAPRGAPVERVFIPIDEKGEPTGGKYYVPQDIYNQLRRQGAAATEKPQGWLLRAAAYRGAVAREAASQRLVVTEFIADYTLDVFDQAARVRIPLGRADASLLPDGTRLDGRVIQPEWDADGSGLLVDVPGPGQFHLELALRPVWRVEDEAEGFDLAIPAVADSRLELSVPSGGPAIEVPTALGAIHLDDDPPRLVAQLGPTDRLRVRWPEGGVPALPSAVPEVEELLWLNVQPGSVVIDVRLKLSGAAGQVRQIRMTCDPRLRLLPLEGDNLPMVEVRGAPGQLQTVLLQWRRPIAAQDVPGLRFVLTGTSGVGNVRLPQMKVLDARSTRSRLAVSVDPALEHEVQAPATFEPVSVPEFLSGWGPSPSMPLAAWRLPSGESNWSMSTRLREPRTSVEQNLALTFDWGMATVQFEAQLLPAAGYIFQHRLRVPPALWVDDLTVLEDGVSRVARWWQDEEGTLTVFLTGLMTGPQTLLLRGRLPVRGRMMPLPDVEIEGSIVESSTIDVFRLPSALVELDAVEGLDRVDDPGMGIGDPQWGRLVGQFRVRTQDPSKATVTMAPNYPRVEGEQVTWLRCPRGTWTAETDWRLLVVGGVADEIHVEAPAPLGGPYQTSPAIPTRWIDTAGEDRQLILRPRAAIEGEYRFRLTTPLTLAPGERAGTTAVAIDGDCVFRLAADLATASAFGGPYGGPFMMGRPTSPLRRFVALPKELDGQPIDWETKDLEAAELPEGFAEPPDARAMAIYRIVGPGFQAIPSRDEARLVARVRLADVELAWQDEGSLAGVARFDLEPGKLSECRLRLPAEYQLLKVSVAGVPVEPVPGDATSALPPAWRVPLGPAGLPQQVEVVFSGDRLPPASGGSQLFAAPMLEGLPVERTLWSVVGPASLEVVSAEGAELPGSPWSHELARLRSAAAAIESASKTPAEDPQSTRRWYGRWIGRLAAARVAIERIAGPERLPGKVQEEIDATDRQQSQIAERLGLSDLYRQAMDQAGAAVSPASLLEPAPDRGQVVVRREAASRLESLTLRFRRAESSGLPSRLAGAVGLAALTILTLVGLRQGTLAEWFARWPHAMGVAVGLAWWLWLWPSVLGWVIVLAGVAASLFAGWRDGVPDSDSTVVVLGAKLP